MSGPAITQDQRNALMHMAGARLAGNAFMAVHAAGMTVWIEARKRNGIHTPLKSNPRRLMGSTVEPLVTLGYVEKVADGSALLIAQTELRP